MPLYFCNPVEKTVAGIVYDIQDPPAHLACYEIGPLMQYDETFLALDQFGERVLTADEDCWLCVPTIKDHWVATRKTTWGKIKSLYRD